MNQTGKANLKAKVLLTYPLSTIEYAQKAQRLWWVTWRKKKGEMHVRKTWRKGKEKGKSSSWGKMVRVLSDSKLSTFESVAKTLIFREKKSRCCKMDTNWRHTHMVVEALYSETKKCSLALSVKLFAWEVWSHVVTFWTLSSGLRKVLGASIYI